MDGASARVATWRMIAHSGAPPKFGSASTSHSSDEAQRRRRRGVNDGLPTGGRQAVRESPGPLRTDVSSRCTSCKRSPTHRFGLSSSLRMPFALLSQRLYVSQFMNTYVTRMAHDRTAEKNRSRGWMWSSVSGNTFHSMSERRAVSFMQKAAAARAASLGRQWVSPGPPSRPICD